MASPSAPPRVARVLLDTRLPQLAHVFDYAITPLLQEQVRFGQRVKVPLKGRGQTSYGWIVELAEHSSYGGQLSELSAVVGQSAPLTPELWQLAQALADRAAGNAGDVLRLAIPTRHARAEAQHLQQREAAAAQLQLQLQELAYAQQQNSLLPLLAAGHKEPANVPEITTGLLAAAKLLGTAEHGMLRLQSGEWVGAWAATIAAVATQLLAAGRSTIICVPDWRDIAQVEDACRAALGSAAAALLRFDAKQSAERRFANYLAALEPQPRIILGNRAAVYAPAANLGAIILWDEADPLLAEPLAPYVHARDAALIRQQQSGCGLLLLSHSHSAAAQRLLQLGYLSKLQTPVRRTKIRHAAMHVQADEYAGRIPEAALRLIRQAADTGPVLVQVAKPGYASAVVCKQCRQRAVCHRCAGPLGAPRSAGKLQCLWCLEPVVQWRCQNCHGKVAHLAAPGALRTVELLQQLLQGYRIVLADGDNIVPRVDARGAVVVATVGAEPVAAGGYSAVVLLDAERLLQIPTLSAAEDCLRWWENAAAKAGPQAICLLASGSGPVVQAFLRGSGAELMQQELRERQTLRYPPMVRVAAVSGPRAQVQQALQQVQQVPECEVLDAVPLPDGSWQGIVRCSYRAGAEVAKLLRAQVIVEATGRITPTKSRPNPKSSQGLRVKFDDRRIFDEPLPAPAR